MNVPTADGPWGGVGLADELGKMGSGKGGHRLPVAFETEAVFQFVGHELEVGRLLKRQELLEEGDDLGRPVRPMVAAGKLGGKLRAFLEEAGAESVKMGALIWRWWTASTASMSPWLNCRSICWRNSLVKRLAICFF